MNNPLVLIAAVTIAWFFLTSIVSIFAIKYADKLNPDVIFLLLLVGAASLTLVGIFDYWCLHPFK